MAPKLGAFAVRKGLCTRCALHESRTLRQYHAKVPNRALISLEGADALPFLQGLIPANLTKRSSTITHDGKVSYSKSIFTVFLNAQGRILHDVLIYSNTLAGQDSDPNNNFLIEVDSRSVDGLMKHIKKHKLRSKFKIRRFDPEELAVWSYWPGPGETPALTKAFTFDNTDSVLCAEDARPGLAGRIILPPNSNSEKLLFDHDDHKESRDYLARRMSYGVAEGSSEIISESSLPQESNFDFLDGIDFRKGCYLGQELTIRTHHTGVVRKRILPVRLSDIGEDDQLGSIEPNAEVDWATFADYPQPLPGSNISKIDGRKGRSAGKWLGGVGNIGLALCRLEMLTDIRLTDTTSYNPEQKWKVSWEDANGTTKELQIHATVPDWLREKLSKPAHEERKPKEEEEEVD